MGPFASPVSASTARVDRKRLDGFGTGASEHSDNESRTHAPSLAMLLSPLASTVRRWWFT
jgi:hypothetical protein